VKLGVLRQGKIQDRQSLLGLTANRLVFRRFFYEEKGAKRNTRLGCSNFNDRHRESEILKEIKEELLNKNGNLSGLTILERVRTVVFTFLSGCPSFVKYTITSSKLFIISK
jgi:hypothetical protein